MQCLQVGRRCPLFLRKALGGVLHALPKLIMKQMPKMLGFHRCPWVLPPAVVPAPVPMPCDWPLEGKKQECMGELMETQTKLFIGNTGGIGRQLQPQGHQLCLCVCKSLFYHRWLNESADGCMG